MLLSLRKNGLTSLFKEVRVFKVSLRYPLSRDTFSAIAAIPQQGGPPHGAFFFTDVSVRYPILQHIARYLCDTPGKQTRKIFAILSLKVSRDMKSIATGPLRCQVPERPVNASMRTPISGIYQITGVGCVVAGRVEQGIAQGPQRMVQPQPWFSWGGMSAERNCPRKTFKSIRKTV